MLAKRASGILRVFLSERCEAMGVKLSGIQINHANEEVIEPTSILEGAKPSVLRLDHSGDIPQGHGVND
jgi:hypothetical protein